MGKAYRFYTNSIARQAADFQEIEVPTFSDLTREQIAICVNALFTFYHNKWIGMHQTTLRMSDIDGTMEIGNLFSGDKETAFTYWHEDSEVAYKRFKEELDVYNEIKMKE